MKQLLRGIDCFDIKNNHHKIPLYDKAGRANINIVYQVNPVGFHIKKQNNKNLKEALSAIFFFRFFKHM